MPSVCWVSELSDALYLQVTQQKTRPSSGQARPCSGVWTCAQDSSLASRGGFMLDFNDGQNIILVVNISSRFSRMRTDCHCSSLIKCPESLRTVRHWPDHASTFKLLLCCSLYSPVSNITVCFNSINLNFSTANNIPAELDWKYLEIVFSCAYFVVFFWLHNAIKTSCSRYKNRLNKQNWR